MNTRVPNKIPMGPREGRRASEARNASQSVAGTTRDGGSGSVSRRRVGAAHSAAKGGGDAASPSAYLALLGRALPLTFVRGGGASPPPLARRDVASRAPRGVRSLEQRTTLPCGPFLLGIACGDTRDKLISAVHPGWLHRGIVGFSYEL